MLKVGYDNFEVTKRPPEVAVCGKIRLQSGNAGHAFACCRLPAHVDTACPGDSAVFLRKTV